MHEHRHRERRKHREREGRMERVVRKGKRENMEKCQGTEESGFEMQHQHMRSCLFMQNTHTMNVMPEAQLLQAYA